LLSNQPKAAKNLVRLFLLLLKQPTTNIIFCLILKITKPITFLKTKDYYPKESFKKRGFYVV
jgi:hypothetical protein